MPFEYESLVGHLYVVGGRAVTMAPPGAVVEASPKRAVRGREADTFFTLILPSGEQIAPPAFYEGMARLAADIYYESSGSVTAGLRLVFNTLNQNLIDTNRDPTQADFEANALCAVLRGEDLIAARTGSGIVLLRQDTTLTTLPADIDNDEALFDPPLGVQPFPEIKLSRLHVTQGSRLILSDASLADFERQALLEATAAEDLGGVLVAFKALARLQLTLLAVEFVPPDVPAPIPVPEGDSMQAIAAAQRAAQQAAQQDAQREKRGERPRRRRQSRVALHTRRTPGAAAGTTANALALADHTLEHYVPDPSSKTNGNTPKKPRRFPSAPLTAGTAVLIPVVIVALVVALWLGGTGQSEFEICQQEANNLAASARALDSGNKDALLTLWGTAINEAQRCTTLRADDPAMLTLIREGQDILDDLNSVERRDAVVLDALPSATFSRILMRGSDLYVLNNANNIVYHAILAEDGLSTERQRLEPILDMREGVNVGGFVVGPLLDITFADNQDALLALDRDGQLITCGRRQKNGCSVQSLLRSEDWVTPQAITVWEDRLYVLDPGANQIWRYERLSGSYAGVPTLYFSGQNQGSVVNAVDFAIDRAGSVFVLRADGIILQYNLGQIQQFELGGFPDGQDPSSAQSMYLDEDPLGQALYMTDRATRTIYRMTQGGTHWATYRIYDEALFESLAGVVANPGQELLYAISGNSIFRLNSGLEP